MDSAKIIGENDDVIRIMSIHKSKGLEFPVVILCNSHKKFNMQDLNKNIFISPEENIVILCTENEPTKDDIMAVTKNSDGKYELENLKIDNKEKEIGGQAGDDVQKENDIKENESELENEKEKGTSMRKKAPWERRMAS